jgi:tetratricopeptide (TPR) repeat protein
MRPGWWWLSALVATIWLGGCGGPASDDGESALTTADAISRYEAALRDDPQNARLLARLAEALFEADDPEGAAMRFEAAIAIDPDDPALHQRLGVVLAENGQLEDALQSYERSLDIAASADTHVLVAIALAQQGKHAEAIVEYEEALVLEPDSVDAHYNLGIELGRAGKWEEAEMHYRQALRVDGGDTDAMNNLGAALLAQGKAEDATGYFERVVRLDLNDADARRNLATALQAEGRVAESVRVLEEALSRFPEHAALANQLAWLRAASRESKWRNGEQAVLLAEKACRLTDESNGNYLDTLAAAYAEMGRFDDAVRTQQRALAAMDETSEMRAPLEQRLALYQAGMPYRER